MPGFNRTGPLGKGPRTGRGLGKCRPEADKKDTATDNEDYPQRIRGRFEDGRGLAQRRGRGRRFRREDS